MAIIVEDGSMVVGANSFVTIQELTDYATARGVTITGDAEQALIKSADFINRQEPKLKGCTRRRDQAMSFPRVDLVLEGWHWQSDEIPRQVKQLQLNLALEVDAGIDLYNRPEPSNKIVKKERIEGAITVEYAVGDSATRTSAFSQSLALLSVLTKQNGLFLVRT